MNSIEREQLKQVLEWTKFNNIKLKEKCTTAYKHLLVIKRQPDGDIEKRCAWCNKRIDDIAYENDIDRMKLWGFYQTQMEII